MRLILFLLAFFVSVTATAAQKKPICFPQTAFFIPATMKTKSGISQKVFNAQLDLIMKQFEPEAEALGFKIHFNRLWADGTINSDTDVEGDEWVINSYGGLARFPGMTADGYLSVACHELGHHLGGAPLYAGAPWPGGGPSAEGEADYFTTIRCLKELGFKDARARAAVQVLADTLAKLEGSPNPKASTPDQSVVKTTNEDHPEAQCRLDTYLAGWDCPDQGVLDNSDPKIHSCFQYSNRKSGLGSRPRCWFAP
jgi:hypothetical protein